MKYKVGDKFIVEIEETADCNCEPWRLYKIKGFNSLVFDDFGLDKLKKQDDEIFELKDLVNVREENIMNLNQKLKKKSEDLAYWKILNAVKESQIEDLKKKLKETESALKIRVKIAERWKTLDHSRQEQINKLKSELEELKNPPKSEGYNGKVVCVKGFEGIFTKGKMYEVSGGIITDNSGHKYEQRFKYIEEINASFVSQFIELVE